MFKKNFEILCAKRNVAPTSVCREIGLSNAAYSCWDENSIPRKTTLMKIANYFGVTVEDLLADDPSQIQEKPVEEPDELDEDIKIIADLVSRLTPEQLDPVLEIAQRISTLDNDEVNAILSVIRCMGKKKNVY